MSSGYVVVILVASGYNIDMQDNYEIIAKRIREARKAKNLTQGEVATHIKVARVSVTNWESGKTKPELDKFGPLAELFGVTPIWLQGLPTSDEGQFVNEQYPSNAKITGEKLQSGGKIPLYGAAVGGEYGEFELNGNKLDDIFAPPSLSGIPGAYGVKIVGDSMSPRFEDNETVYVNPKRRPVKGDYVIVEIYVDEHSVPLAYIKRLVRHTVNELVLEQFNPAKELKFDGSRVKSVHYVLRWGE